MTPNHNSLDAYVRRLIEQEGAMQRLYELYGACDPAHSRLWNTLARQEAAHEKSLRRLHTDMVAGGATFKASKRRGQNIEDTLEFIRRCANKCENGELDSLSALQSAAFLENTLIENRIFDCFEGTSPAVVRGLDSLRQETIHHLALIESHLPAPASPPKGAKLPRA